MYALASRLRIAALFLSPMMTLTATAKEHELLYVGNNHSGTISVISVPEFEVLGEFDGVPDLAERKTFRTPAQVDDLVAPESGEVLYVSRPKTRDIAAFSTETEELLWRMPTPGKPDHLAITPDGKTLYVSILNEDMVVAVDTASRSVVGSFPTSPMPHGVAVSPSGKYIFSGAISGDQMVIAEASSLKVVKTIEFESGVRPFAVTEDERSAYVQISKLHGFVVLDIESGRITQTVHLPNPDNIFAQKSFPHTAHHGLVLTPDNRYLCVNATMEGYVGILSVPDLKLLATIPVGEQPSWIITSLDGNYCYASARVGNTVSIISIEDRKEIKRIPVGDYPQRMWTTRVTFRRVSR